MSFLGILSWALWVTALLPTYALVVPSYRAWYRREEWRVWQMLSVGFVLLVVHYFLDMYRWQHAHAMLWLSAYSCVLWMCASGATLAEWRRQSRKSSKW